MTTPEPAPRYDYTFHSRYLEGRYTIIDLSWYEPYKQYGDNIITMFFYLGFIWHIFVKFSNLIQGNATTFERISSISNDSNITLKE